MSLRLVQVVGHIPTVQQPLRNLPGRSAPRPALLERWMLSSACAPGESSICRMELKKPREKLPAMRWVSVHGGQLRSVSPRPG